MTRGTIRFVVTGGAGFIGSAVIWGLNQLGIDNIIVVDRLDKSEKWRNLVPLRFADYVDADDFIELLDGDSLSDVGTIFHLGACSSTTETDVDYLIHNNYEYTRTLAIWSIDRDVRFIYASSAATYGNGAQGMIDGVNNLNNYRPLNPYGYSKHLFDLFATREGLFDDIVGLKYFNVFGPNESHKGDMRSLVNKAYDQIRETGRIKLFKSHHPDYQDGEFGRDFLYVKDAVAMTLHFMETETGGLFNIGSGKTHSWNDLAHAIFKALDRPAQIEYIEMPEELRDRYQYHTQANLTRLQRSGFRNGFTPLEEAVEDYVRNYLAPGKHLGD